MEWYVQLQYMRGMRMPYRDILIWYPYQYYNYCSLFLGAVITIYIGVWTVAVSFINASAMTRSCWILLVLFYSIYLNLLCVINTSWYQYTLLLSVRVMICCKCTLFSVLNVLSWCFLLVPPFVLIPNLLQINHSCILF